MVTGVLESHFSTLDRVLQFVHLNERPERMKSEERLNHIYTYNKTISKGVVLLILLSSKIGYTAGVATCSIIRSSTVDLYLYSYSKTVLR